MSNVINLSERLKKPSTVDTLSSLLSFCVSKEAEIIPFPAKQKNKLNITAARLRSARTKGA